MLPLLPQPTFCTPKSSEIQYFVFSTDKKLLSHPHQSDPLPTDVSGSTAKDPVTYSKWTHYRDATIPVDLEQLELSRLTTLSLVKIEILL